MSRFGVAEIYILRQHVKHGIRFEYFIRIVQSESQPLQPIGARIFAVGASCGIGRLGSITVLEMASQRHPGIGLHDWQYFCGSKKRLYRFETALIKGGNDLVELLAAERFRRLLLIRLTPHLEQLGRQADELTARFDASDQHIAQTGIRRVLSFKLVYFGLDFDEGAQALCFGEGFGKFVIDPTAASLNGGTLPFFERLAFQEVLFQLFLNLMELLEEQFVFFFQFLHARVGAGRVILCGHFDVIFQRAWVSMCSSPCRQVLSSGGGLNDRGHLDGFGADDQYREYSHA